ncbi:MAG: helix-turn-helix domain-containing protein [Clostridiales bacterium]|nr:helix-turn-helix domain-containing protein [Clostridiales bacterium]
MTTGEKIYGLRKEARITQEEFAEKLEVSRQAVSKWEQDAAFPDTEKIIKIAELFGVSLDFLLRENQTVNDGAVGRQRRAFLSMFISLAVACSAVGFIVASVCYYAVDDVYCSLIGLGVLAGFLLIAFVLWSVGRYLFLSKCAYLEADKTHLARWTKAFYFTAIILLFAYLPSVVFCQFTATVTYNTVTSVTLTVYRRLKFGEFVMSAIIYGVAGYCVAYLLSLAHGKVLGKSVGAAAVCDRACVAASVLAALAAYSYGMYHADGYYFTETVLIFSSVFSAAAIAQAVVHKIYEKTETAIFVLQLVCAAAFLSITVISEAVILYYDSAALYITYALGGILAAGAIAALILASVAAGKRKRFKELLSLRLPLSAYIILGALLIAAINYAPMSGVLITLTVFAAVAALLHAPFIRGK